MSTNPLSQSETFLLPSSQSLAVLHSERLSFDSARLKTKHSKPKQTAFFRIMVVITSRDPEKSR